MKRKRKKSEREGGEKEKKSEREGGEKERNFVLFQPLQQMNVQSRCHSFQVLLKF